MPEFKDVEQQVEQDYYESKMEPAIRDYLTKMREDAYIDLKPGFDDTGASTNKRVNPIAYSAYTPPQPKKKKKVERTRFRETAHFRSKTTMPGQDTKPAQDTTQADEKADTAKNGKKPEQASMKPGKREKIRYGKAPTKTLPAGPAGQTEDAGAGTQVAQAAPADNPLEQQAPEKTKTRFSDRARTHKDKKQKNNAERVSYPAQSPTLAPDAAEVADRQTQSAPLGLNGDTSKKKKKSAATTTGEKTRLSDRNKNEKPDNKTPVQPTPIPQAQGAPAPGQAPAPAPAPNPPAENPPAQQPQR
jgi:peptidyl-prolyl cis-trans isomerase SurA